jgi:hypothetical protein
MQDSINVYVVRIGPVTDDDMAADHDRDLVLESTMRLFGMPSVLHGKIDTLIHTDLRGANEVAQAVLDQLQSMRLVQDRIAPISSSALSQQGKAAVDRARAFIQNQVRALRQSMLRHYHLHGNILVLAHTPVTEMFVQPSEHLLDVGEIVEAQFPVIAKGNDNSSGSRVWRREDLRGDLG